MWILNPRFNLYNIKYSRTVGDHYFLWVFFCYKLWLKIWNFFFLCVLLIHYVSTATFFLLHCDKWDRVVALPRHKFVTGATLLQLVGPDRGSNRTGGEHANWILNPRFNLYNIKYSHTVGDHYFLWGFFLL
jgi:hypothetical protein